MNSVLLFPFLVAGLPLFDAIFAMIRRRRRRVSLFLGDRRHTYDLMLARRWPVRRIALAFYAATAALAAIASWGVRSQSPQFRVVAAVSLGLLIFVAIRLGSLRSGEGDRATMGVPKVPAETHFGESSKSV